MSSRVSRIGGRTVRLHAAEAGEPHAAEPSETPVAPSRRLPVASTAPSVPPLSRHYLIPASWRFMAPCMMLGLLRWPSIQWELGRAYATAAAPERATLDAVFAGLNSYLGNFIA